ncbi:MAG: hypothetical protein QM770_08995 [Tepidisphaeraceae bacterium]
MNQMAMNELERRTLLAASVVNGILMVAGTEGRDVIEVTLTPIPAEAGSGAISTDVLVELHMNGRVAWSLKTTGGYIIDAGRSYEVPPIYVAALGGNDDIDLRDYVASATVLGGAGNDTIRTAERNDTIVGGAGNDWIDSGNGDDFVDGGKGDDYFIFRRGVASGEGSFRLNQSVIHGGAGNDRAVGDDNNAFLFGSGVEFVGKPDATIDADGKPTGAIKWTAPSVQFAKGKAVVTLHQKLSAELTRTYLGQIASTSAPDYVAYALSDRLFGSGKVQTIKTDPLPTEGLLYILHNVDGTQTSECRDIEAMAGHYELPTTLNSNFKPVTLTTSRSGGHVFANVTVSLPDSGSLALLSDPVRAGDALVLDLFLLERPGPHFMAVTGATFKVDLGAIGNLPAQVRVRGDDGRVFSAKLVRGPRG